MNDVREYSLDEIVATLEELVKRPHVSPDYVRFRVELLKAQDAVRAAQRLIAPSPTAGDEPFDPDEIVSDPAALAKLLAALQEAGGTPEEHDDQLGRLREVAGARPGLLLDIVKRAAFRPEDANVAALADELDVSPDVLVFAARVLAAPLVADRGDWRRVPGNDKPRNRRCDDYHCPTCNSSAGLALLIEDEGRRVLCCSLCGQQWGFRRLACPRCGNRDQDALGKILVTDQDTRWIEICDACNGYIKTIDTRELATGPNTLAIAEDVATLHLDLLAEKEGYRRNPPYTALV